MISISSNMRPRRQILTLWGLSGLLFVLNAIVCHELFTVEYLKYFHSIEGTFIAMARVMAERYSSLTWWPLWNAGMPFQYAYFPLLPGSTAIVSAIAGWSAALAYHVVTALAYSLGPVALFGFAYVLSGRLKHSFLAAILYSLVSACSLLIPQIWNESRLNAPRRLYNHVFYGEGPHMAALTLVPVALLLLYLFARNGRRIHAVLATLAMGATVLTNSFGSVTLFFGVVFLLVSGAIPFRFRSWAWTIAVCVAAYIFVSPWLPPSMIGDVARHPGREGDVVVIGRSAGLAILIAGIASIAALTHRFRTPTHIRFFILFGWYSTVTPVLYYTLGWIPLPQSSRYQLEMDMGLALLAAFLVPEAILRSRVVWLVFAALIAAQTHYLTSYAGRLIEPADLNEQIEYRISKAFERLSPGQRVMAGGSTSLWLNVFTDLPQLSGGHSPTAPNWQQLVAVFTIYSGMNAGAQDGEIASLWLKAFGVRAVSVSEPNGKEAYKPYVNSAKFKGLLPEIWREGGDVIYAIPSRSPSLVSVVPDSAVVRRPPVHGLDVGEVRRYVAALDDPAMPVPRVHWESWSRATLMTDVGAGQVISVRMNHFPGWRASSEGRPLRVTKDGIGLMVIHPERTGSTQITLEYSRTLEATIARVAQILTGVIALIWLAFQSRPVFRN